MKFESKETIATRDGIHQHWRIGPLSIEWYAERPPQSWIRFQMDVSIRWYDE